MVRGRKFHPTVCAAGFILASSWGFTRAHAFYQPSAALPGNVQGSYDQPVGAAAAAPQDALDRLPYVPGHLIVKMKPTVSACIDCLVELAEPLAPAIGSDHLDDLNRRYGLRDARPLRGAYARLNTLQARQALELRQRERMGTTTAQRFGRPLAVQSEPSFAGVYVLQLSPWFDMEKVAREYARDPAVAWAEPDRKVHVQLTPNDPYFSSSGSWGQSFDDLWGIKLIDAPAAWDSVQGSGVVVAVTDTGVDYTHPDISANMWVNLEEIPGDGIDNDRNGYVDDVYGWNFVAGTNEVQDDFGHGTHVAGTIAATGQNGIGVIGVAWQSRIMALKGLDAHGGGLESNLADAILYAAENGANVINASWGGFGQAQVIDDAIAVAAAHGVVFVAAAGNSNVDVENNLSGPFFPAANHNAITVAAIDHLSQKAFFSNFGTKIDVAAPGGGDGGETGNFRTVLSLRASGADKEMTGYGALVVGHKYLRQAGTSMAAPHVAGAAALILSAHPSYSPAEVRQALHAGADDLGDPGFDIYFGYGRVNAARSSSITVLDVAITAPASGFVATGTEVTFTGSATGPDFASYVLEYGAGVTPTSWTPITDPITSPVSNGQLGVWDTRNVLDGSYAVRIRAQNTVGVNFEDRINITLDHVHISDPQSDTIFRPPASLDVRGAAGGNGFQSFRIEWRITTPDYVTGPWRSEGMTLTGGGLTPVSDDVLATFDTSSIAQNSDLDFRVVVTGSAGEVAKEMRHVVLDPTLRPGWPQQLPGFPNLIYRLMHHVTIADLYGNGKKEVLAAYGDMVYVFRDDGTLMPGWPQRLNGPTNSTHWVRHSPAAADLDGDGQLEVITTDAETNFGGPAHGDGDTYIWHADGTPMAGWPKHIALPYGGAPPTFGGPLGDFALADVDGDGRTEIITVLGPGLAVMDANGNMLPGWPQYWPPGQSAYFYPAEEGIAVGDVNGDGQKEIAWIIDYPQRVVLYSAQGQIMHGFPKRLPGEYDGRSFYGFMNAPIMADLDGDGKLDVIAMGRGKRLRAFRGDGRGIGLHPRQAQALPNRQCARGHRIALMAPILEPPTAADFFGDGRAELFVGGHTKTWERHAWCPAPDHSTDYINVMRVGPAVPGWPVAVSYPQGDNPYGVGSVAIGDIDGDMRPEVVSGNGICGFWDPSYGFAGHRCFTVSAYDQAGNLLLGFPKATPGPGLTEGMTPAIGDLAGDGLKEIVFIEGFGNIMVWDVPGTPAPEAMQWPMFRHDPDHTAALAANP